MLVLPVQVTTLQASCADWQGVAEEEEERCLALAELMANTINRLPKGGEMACFWGEWLPQLEVGLEDLDVCLTSLPDSDAAPDLEPEPSIYEV